MKFFIILALTAFFTVQSFASKSKSLPTIEATIEKSKFNIINYKANQLSLENCANNHKGIKASSSLGKEYIPRNILDFDLSTAWVEGNKDYGINEYIELSLYNSSLAPDTILNGYHKSKKLWKANSRVKLFKVYINNEACCYLKLKDSMELQKFTLPKYDSNGKEDNIYKFEIKEVYKGSKYKDTAISALNSSLSEENCTVNRMQPWGCCDSKKFTRDFTPESIVNKDNLTYNKKTNKLFTGCISTLESDFNIDGGGGCAIYKNGKVIMKKEDNGSCADSSCHRTKYDKDGNYFKFDTGNGNGICFTDKDVKEGEAYKSRNCTEKENKKYWKVLKMNDFCGKGRTYPKGTWLLCKDKK
jgi:hypothetical protein